ncbi:MAG TPA: glycoside hydrolase family 31 protein [Candidatus Pelethocola excrementipullorum]|nr:glycoside hydrolase family 31 protein [Candidatus Pelethocola excrementipullorum]
MFGKMLDFKQDGQRVTVTFVEKEVMISVYTSTIWNVFVSMDGSIQESNAIEGNKMLDTAVKVEQIEDHLEISTDQVTAKIYDDCKIDFYDGAGNLKCEDYRGERKYQSILSQEMIDLAKQEGHDLGMREDFHYKIEVVKSVCADECFYGLGDKTGFLNKRGYDYEMWNTDNPMPHEDNFKVLYKSIPFFMSQSSRGTYGIFFDNSYHSYFDMAKENDAYCFFGADEGNLDYYYFGADGFKEIIKDYTYLTGRTPLPQLWTLGYQQSRWGYVTENDVREVASKMREFRIPCDVIHLDIDYMQGYRVFTWNKDRYKDPKQTISDLAKDGFKIVTIIDPGVKKDEDYYIYQEGVEHDYFAKTPKGEIYENVVWPGTSVYPDFGQRRVQEWWSDKHKFLVDMGVRGIWNDMNEPASFEGELPPEVVFHDHDKETTHAKIHNVYGHLMCQATYEGMRKYDKRRPFVITRACYSGTQKYSTAWTGDNHSLWSHLRMAIPQLCNLGLSGMNYVGTDIGGFGSDTTKELLCRWIQVGIFSPLCRNHAAAVRKQEPWQFDTETADIYRKYVELRYQLIPYLYDLFKETQSTGLPMIRPLILEYPEDAAARQLNDEFMFGSSILAAPVVEQGQTARMVYLPEGTWVDYHTGETILGPIRFIKDAPLDICPIYLKAGSIIPNYTVQNYIGEKEQSTLILQVIKGNGTYYHYQDDGESFAYENGVYNEYKFTITDQGLFTAEMTASGYKNRYKKLKVVYENREVLIDILEGDHWSVLL